MIIVTQLVYLTDGQEKTFDEFESMAIPMISKHHGKLLLRIRPSQNCFIEGVIENPYEIHLVEFESEEDFENFMTDEERKKFLHLKEKAIHTSILIKGTKL